MDKGITAILTLYRREEYLKEQISALRNQTVPPEEIWIWVNSHPDNVSFKKGDLDVDRVFYNDHNWKYHGRFAAGLLARTEFIAIFDDDTIPGRKWFENCLATIKLGHDGILGSAGVILQSPYYVKHERVGWNGTPPNQEVKEVDLVGHSWFFRREYLRYFWDQEPLSWDNGEDIHFSYVAQKLGNINTFVPPHPDYDLEMHGSIKGWSYGTDKKASSNGSLMPIGVFYLQRDVCIQHAMSDGWRTVNAVDKLWNQTGMDKNKTHSE